MGFYAAPLALKPSYRNVSHDFVVGYPLVAPPALGAPSVRAV